MRFYSSLFSPPIITQKEELSMYNAEETKELRSTIALELARHKMQIRVAGGEAPTLNDTDLNELFVVAGLPLLEPGKIEKELEVI